MTAKLSPNVPMVAAANGSVADDAAAKPGRANKANAVADMLRLEIATGHWPAGTVLPPEADLLKHFEVSRPPMREAMRMLESEGLLRATRGQRGGARVLSPDLGPVARAFGVYVQRRDATLEDLFQSLALCESVAIREIAEVRPQSVLIALAQTAAAQGLCLNDRSEFRRYEVEFRRTLVDACSNQIVRAMGIVLTDVYDQHMRTINEMIPPLDLQRERFERGAAAKQRLLALILQGDADGAEKKWKSYLQLFSKLTSEILSDSHIQYYPRGEVRVIAKDENRTLQSADTRSGPSVRKTRKQA